MGRSGKKHGKGKRRPPGDETDTPPGPVGNPLLHAWPDARLDLHGRTAAEAEMATRNFLLTQSRLGAGRILHVITGKGSGTLFERLGRLLAGDLERWIAESAPDLQGAGYRIRVR